MTGAAWLMLGITWAVILFFTGKFFWMVLTIQNPESLDEPDDGVPRKDA